MSDDKVPIAKSILRRVDGVFTEEALKMNDGKTVPLRLEPGGPIIGEATMKYDPGLQALMAEYRVDDPQVAEALWESPPIFGQES